MPGGAGTAHPLKKKVILYHNLAYIVPTLRIPSLKYHMTVQNSGRLTSVGGLKSVDRDPLGQL
jgi:hypothetical protein